MRLSPPYPLVLGLTGLLLVTALPSLADGNPKLGANAIPIQGSHEYLQSSAAPDYWALSPYYLPQGTASSCSVAAIAMLVNALRGLPASEEVPLVTEQALLEAAVIPRWRLQTAENGSGVTWDELQRYVRASLQAFDVAAQVDVLKPEDASAASLAQVRSWLMQNEETDEDIVLVYFNQGVLTGSWDGPHISPIAAYDARRRRALVMDVDRQWYVPYWVADDKLLEAMLKPAPSSRGALAGQTGGLIRATRQRPQPPKGAPRDPR